MRGSVGIFFQTKERNNTKMKKALSVFLIIAVVSSLVFSVSVFAEYETVKVDGIKYTSYDTCCDVTGCNKEKSGDLIIPSSVKFGDKDLPVTSISYGAFSDCRSLTSVTIPDSVTSIGDNAFRGCSDLTSVTIGDGVTSIGSYAFYDCSNLTSINIPDGVMSTHYYGFFYGCNNLTYNEYDNALYLGNDDNPYHALIKAKNTSITNVAINKKTKVVSDNAFSGCSGLTSVTIPNGVTSIGDSAFSGCSGLTNINIPDGVISLGDKSFSYCSNLESIRLPDSVNSLGEAVFCGCTSLESVMLPDGLTKILSFCWVYDKEATYYGSFEDCTNLKTIYIPASILTLEMESFKGCDNLETVYFGGSEEQWKNIWIESDSPLLNAEIVFNYSKPAPEPGDTNGDGAVDNKDVVTLFRYVSSGNTGYIVSYDFNGDNEVNNKDVVALFRAVSAK